MLHPDQQEKKVTVFDSIATFWQLLQSLDRADFVTEVIVNDIDAGATKTTISFEKDRVIVNGNGTIIDSDGWDRLRVIQGAGYEVDSKQGGIGVKNHGLNTGLLVGDQITISSGNFLRTRYINKNQNDDSNGSNRPVPAVSDPPTPVAERVDGCEIEIPYRKNDFSIPPGLGERFSISALTEEDIAKMYQDAARDLPKLLIGIVRSGLRSNYSLVLKHWRLGETRVDYKCGPTTAVSKRMVYIRTCKQTGKPDYRERVWQLRIPSHVIPFQVPDYFIDKRSVVLEIAWPIDTKGAPLPGGSEMRYPAAYPDEDNGIGVSFSAPWTSDNARHALQRHNKTNDYLKSKLIEELGESVKLFGIPRYGSKALNFLPKDTNVDEINLNDLIKQLVKINGLPVKKRTRANKKGPVDSKVKAGTGSDTNSVVVPAYTDGRNTSMPKPLVELIPIGRHYLDPHTPEIFYNRFIVMKPDVDPALKERTITFDEDDVFERLSGETPNHFEWRSFLEASEIRAFEWHGRASLDVLEERLNLGDNTHISQVYPTVRGYLPHDMVLPGNDGKSHKASNLARKIRAPENIDGITLPIPVMEALADHPVLRKKDWQLQDYDLDAFIEKFKIHEQPSKVKQQVWNWLKTNFDKLAERDRRKFAPLEVWMTESGGFSSIQRLCYPKSRRTRKLLHPVLEIPDSAVKKLPGVKLGGGATLSIREVPTVEEFLAFVRTHKGHQFSSDDTPVKRLTKAKSYAYKSFERDLVKLAKDKNITDRLKDFFVKYRIVIRNSSGGADSFTNLVQDSQLIQRLRLDPSDIAAPRPEILEKLNPAPENPTTSAVKRALESDPHNTKALMPRLTALRKAVESATQKRSWHSQDRGRDSDEDIEQLKCLVVDGEIRSPNECYIRANNQDFWAESLTPYDASEYPSEGQDLLRWMGLASGTNPSPEHSQRFFAWLNKSVGGNKEQYLPQILSHINKHKGNFASSLRWVPIFKGYRLNLTDLSNARHTGQHNYYDDQHELARSVIVNHNSVLGIIPVGHKKVRFRVDEIFEKLGIRSLSSVSSINHYKHYRGRHEGVVSARVEELLEKVKSSWFRNQLVPHLQYFKLPDLDWMDRSWNRQFSNIQNATPTAEIVESLTAWYSISGHQCSYEVKKPSGFDEKSGTFYYVSNNQPAEKIVADALTDLISRKTPPPGVNLYVKELMLGNSEAAKHLNSLAPDDYEYDEHFSEETNTTTSEGYGEAFPSHKVPKREVRLPDPQPLESPTENEAEINTNNTRNGSRSNGDESRRNSSNRATPEFERRQTAALKNKHYKAHCQICLAEFTPNELAGSNSYIKDYSERVSLIEANHCDLVSAQGDWGAHNLILLCRKKHHTNPYADHLSRKVVLEALHQTRRPKKVIYKSDDPKESWDIDGFIVEVYLSTRDETIKIFFEKYHAKYWMDIDNQ